MELDALIALQRDRECTNVHLASIDSTGFRLAHTDDERAEGDLENCPLHLWLVGRSRAPVPEGIYVVVPHEPDAYSEPYGASPWDFHSFRTFLRAEDDGRE